MIRPPRTRHGATAAQRDARLHCSVLREAGIRYAVPCDHAKYGRYARPRTAFALFGPGFLAASCDEAFDLTDYLARHGVERIAGAEASEVRGQQAAHLFWWLSRLLAGGERGTSPTGTRSSSRRGRGRRAAPTSLRRLPGERRERAWRLRVDLRRLLGARGGLCALFHSSVHVPPRARPRPPQPRRRSAAEGRQERTFEPTGPPPAKCPRAIPATQALSARLAQRMARALIATVAPGVAALLVRRPGGDAAGAADRAAAGAHLAFKLKQDNCKHEDVTLPACAGCDAKVPLEPIALARLDEQLRANRLTDAGQGGGGKTRSISARRTCRNLRPATPSAARTARCTPGFVAEHQQRRPRRPLMPRA